MRTDLGLVVSSLVVALGLWMLAPWIGVVSLGVFGMAACLLLGSDTPKEEG